MPTSSSRPGDAPRVPSDDSPPTRAALRASRGGARSGADRGGLRRRRSLPTGLRWTPAAALSLVGVLGGVGAGAAVSGDVLTTVLPSASHLAQASVQQLVERAPEASRGGGRTPVGDRVAAETDETGDPVPTAGPTQEAVEPTAEPVEASTVPEPAPVDVVEPLVVLPEGVDEAGFAAGLLSPDVPPAATGVLDVVPGEVPAPGAGEVKTVRVQVERGLEVDAEKFATLVMDTLNDPRSWGGDGSQTFARTEGEATFAVTLASPATTDALCAPLETEGLWSCGQYRHAVLNHMRWVEGSGIFGDDLAGYRQYLVNHEVGHVLGHKHVSCGAPEDPAPVMVQQSGDVLSCRPNGWPFP